MYRSMHTGTSCIVLHPVQIARCLRRRSLGILPIKSQSVCWSAACEHRKSRERSCGRVRTYCELEKRCGKRGGVLRGQSWVSFGSAVSRRAPRELQASGKLSSRPGICHSSSSLLPHSTRRRCLRRRPPRRKRAAQKHSREGGVRHDAGLPGADSRGRGPRLGSRSRRPSPVCLPARNPGPQTESKPNPPRTTEPTTPARRRTLLHRAWLRGDAAKTVKIARYPRRRSLGRLPIKSQSLCWNAA